MNTRNTLWSLALLVVFAILFAASATEQKIPIQRIPAAFDYSPPMEGFERSKDISFILIAPHFADAFQLKTREPYTSFTKSMETDFVEMLTARGYPYKGPYSSYDELVYADKKTADLILEVEVDLKLMTDNFYKSYQLSSSSPPRYYADGELVIDGKLNLIASEPFTKTRVWVKSIPIQPVRKYVKSEKKYMAIADISEDAAVWNALVEALKEPYAKSMQLAWNHLEPLELEVKKQEAVEIKKNSGFIKN